jgi:hypothetical protein
MKPVIIAAFIAATTAGPAWAQGVPTINIEPSCRAAADTNIANIAKRENYDSCMRSEREAREALVKEWNAFAAADRVGCHRLTTLGTPGTYTELLTCLEMKRDARRVPDTLGTVGRGSR